MMLLSSVFIFLVTWLSHFFGCQKKHYGDQFYAISECRKFYPKRTYILSWSNTFAKQIYTLFSFYRVDSVP
jgi:hypothetical protein